MARHRHSRFDPYVRQARTQAELQFGPQESALATLLASAQDDFRTTRKAERGAARGIAASVEDARPRLEGYFRDAGLNPADTSTPAAKRVAETLANAQVELQQREVRAQEGAAYGVQQALQDLHKQVGEIGSQVQQLGHQRGLYASSVLEQLIGDDRKQRRTINAERRKQESSALQNELDRINSRGNALIGHGIDPATGTPLPEPPSKAKDKPKGPTLTPNQRNQALDRITAARGLYQQGSGEPGFKADLLRNGLRVGQLPGADGKAIKIPRVQSDVEITAGFELAKHGHLSAKTYSELKARHYRVPKAWQPPRPPKGPVEETANTVGQILGSILG